MVERIVRGHTDQTFPFDEIAKLEMWLPHFHAKGFRFVTPTHSTAVIIRERDDGLTQQFWAKKALSRNVKAMGTMMKPRTVVEPLLWKKV